MGKSLERFRMRQTSLKEGDYVCPECGEKTILTSGFSGKPFCWGNCYHYFRWEQIPRMLGDSAKEYFEQQVILKYKEGLSIEEIEEKMELNNEEVKEILLQGKVL